jgi:hypothetical protein
MPLPVLIPNDACPSPCLSQIMHAPPRAYPELCMPRWRVRGVVVQALEKALLAFHTSKMADINKVVKELWQKT